jgi:hypothetical protein
VLDSIASSEILGVITFDTSVSLWCWYCSISSSFEILYPVESAMADSRPFSIDPARLSSVHLSILLDWYMKAADGREVSLHSGRMLQSEISLPQCLKRPEEVCAYLNNLGSFLWAASEHFLFDDIQQTQRKRRGQSS